MENHSSHQMDDQLEREMAEAVNKMSQEEGQSKGRESQLEDELGEASKMIEGHIHPNDRDHNQIDLTSMKESYLKQIEGLARLFSHCFDTLNSVATGNMKETDQLQLKKKDIQQDLANFQIDTDIPEDVHQKLIKDIRNYLEDNVTTKLERLYETQIKGEIREESDLLKDLKKNSTTFTKVAERFENELRDLRKQVEEERESIKQLDAKTNITNEEIGQEKIKLDEINEHLEKIELKKNRKNHPELSSSNQTTGISVTGKTDLIDNTLRDETTQKSELEKSNYDQPKPAIQLLDPLKQPLQDNQGTFSDNLQVTTIDSQPITDDRIRTTGEEIVNKKMRIEKILDHIVLLDADMRDENEELHEVVQQVLQLQRFKEVEKKIVEVLGKTIEAIRKIGDTNEVGVDKEIAVLDREIKETKDEAVTKSPKGESNQGSGRHLEEEHHLTDSRRKILDKVEEEGNTRGINIVGPSPQDQGEPPSTEGIPKEVVQEAEKTLEQAVEVQHQSVEKTHEAFAELVRLRMLHEKIVDNIAIHSIELDRIKYEIDTVKKTLSESEEHARLLESVNRLLNVVNKGLDQIRNRSNDYRDHLDVIKEKEKTTQSLLKLPTESKAQYVDHESNTGILGGTATLDQNLLSEQDIITLIDSVSGLLNTLISGQENVENSSNHKDGLLVAHKKLEDHVMSQEQILRELSEAISNIEVKNLLPRERLPKLEEATNLLQSVKSILEEPQEVASIIREAEQVLTQKVEQAKKEISTEDTIDHQLNLKAPDLTTQAIEGNVNIPHGSSGLPQLRSSTAPEDPYHRLRMHLEELETKMPDSVEDDQVQRDLREKVISRLNESLSKLSGKIHKENENHQREDQSSKISSTRERLIQTHHFEIYCTPPPDSPKSNPTMQPINKEVIKQAIDKLISAMEKHPKNVKDIRDVTKELDKVLLTQEKIIENIMFQETEFESTSQRIKETINEVRKNETNLKNLKESAKLLEKVIELVSNCERSSNSMLDLSKSLEQKMNDVEGESKGQKEQIDKTNSANARERKKDFTNENQDKQETPEIALSFGRENTFSLKEFESLEKYLTTLDARLNSTSVRDLREKVVALLAESTSKLSGKIQSAQNINLNEQHLAVNTRVMSSEFIHDVVAQYLDSSVNILRIVVTLFRRFGDTNSVNDPTITDFYGQLIENNNSFYATEESSVPATEETLRQIMEKERDLQVNILNWVESSKPNAGHNSHSMNSTGSVTSRRV